MEHALVGVECNAMSVSAYCRTCARRTDKSHRFRSFQLRSAAADSLLALVHYVNTGIYRCDGLPQNVCLQCVRRLTVTRDFIFKVRDAQEVLQSMFPKNADLDPINVHQNPVLNNGIKEELKENAFYMTKELLSSDDMADASGDYTDDPTEIAGYKDSHGADDVQNHTTIIKPDYDVTKSKIVKSELHVESSFDENSDVNSDSSSEHESLLGYEEVKIECSEIPNLISNSDIKDLTKYDKWKQYKVPKINVKNKEFPIQNKASKSKAKTTNVNYDDELPLYNNIPTVAKWIDDKRAKQRKFNVKKTFKQDIKHTTKENIIHDDQGDDKEVKTDMNTPSTSKERMHEPIFNHEPIVQIETNSGDKVKSDTSSDYSSSDDDEEDGTFLLPFYNGLPTTLLDVPEKSVDRSLPSWKDYFRCKRCKKNTKTVQDLMDHSMEEHTSCMPFKCYKCSVSIISRKHFFQHMFKHDKNLKQCCEYCGERFVSVSDATWHKETEHPVDKKSFQCRLCDTGFDTNGELKCHEDTFIIGNRGPYICDHCQQEFPIKFDLKAHMERHYPSKHICKICNKSFKSKYILQQHHDVHKTTMNHICQVCGKGFKQKSHYKVHQSIHSDVKPYECDICKKKFKMASQVKRHKQCHGPPLFKCESCGKAFRYQNCLKVHLRMHSNEKPYACDMCNKKFANWSNYNTHMKRIHGQNMAKTKLANIVLS